MARSLIADYLAAQDPYDGERLAPLRHPEWSAVWPQSGERIPSHEADRQINENYPGYPKHEFDRVSGRDEQWAMSPSMTPVRVTESGNLWAIEARLEYPGGDRWLLAGFGELQDGLVIRETSYYCKPFEAAEWRAPWVERIPEGEHPPLDAGAGETEKHRDAIRRFFDVMTAEGWTTMPVLWHDDAVIDYPQSGERVRGIQNIVAIPMSHPNPPRARDHRVTGEGDLFMLENDLVYGDGSQWFELVILAFRGEKVARSVHYFAEPFDPPEWRSQWVERM